VMIAERNRITQGQLMFLIIQTQIEVGILSLPFSVQSVAKGGAWISVLIGGGAIQVIILLLWALGRRFPESTLYEYLPKLLGGLPGKIMGFAYIAFFLLVGGMFLTHFSDVVGRWILVKTPRWFLLALLIGTSMYLVQESIRTIARFFVFVTFLIVFLLLICVYAYTVNVNFDYLFPITEAGWPNIVKGAKETLIAFLGFECLLVVYPFVEGKADGKLKAAIAANFLVTLLFTFIVITALIIFSPPEIAIVPEPVLYMVRAFRLQVIDRLDLIFISLWVFTAATTFMMYLFLAANGLGYYFHRGKHRKAVPYAAMICFVIAMIPQTPADIKIYDQLVVLLSYGFIVGIPLLLLLLSYLFKRKETESY
jgi:spore germination protein (amino acid permease)